MKENIKAPRHWPLCGEPVIFPHKWPVTRQMFPFDDVIMVWHWLPLWGLYPCVPSVCQFSAPHLKIWGTRSWSCWEQTTWQSTRITVTVMATKRHTGLYLHFLIVSVDFIQTWKYVKVRAEGYPNRLVSASGLNTITSVVSGRLQCLHCWHTAHWSYALYYVECLSITYCEYTRW